jgi:hypothetical protein
LEENINATNLNLSSQDFLIINQYILSNFFKGDLLPEAFAKFSNR